MSLTNKNWFDVNENLTKKDNIIHNLVIENAKLREALQSMVDFASHQMHPEQNDPSAFDDDDFGTLNYAKQLLEGVEK